MVFCRSWFHAQVPSSFELSWTRGHRIAGKHEARSNRWFHLCQYPSPSPRYLTPASWVQDLPSKMPAHLQIFQQLKSQWSKYHGLGKRLSRKMPTLVYESTASSRSSGIIDQHSGPERSERKWKESKHKPSTIPWRYDCQGGYAIWQCGQKRAHNRIRRAELLWCFESSVSVGIILLEDARLASCKINAVRK